MPTPFPTQLTGAKFLANRQHALLADEPRCGKTGTAIMAADYNIDDTILIVTTASGRAMWKRAWAAWSAFPRELQVITDPTPLRAPVVIVGWAALANPKIRAALLARPWDRIILDEAHKAKNFENKTTQATYGVITEGGEILLPHGALVFAGKGVWLLTGTPLPHDPSDIYAMMRALCPDRLTADPERGWPNVTKEQDFVDRYCKWRMKKLPRGFRKIRVIMGGKNEDELRARLDGFMRLLTQKDVGIREPIYETMPLAVSDRMLAEVEGDLKRTDILEAARKGDTRALEMHLGPLRRMTGEMKAHAVVEAVKDEFDGGLDKIVLAYWHKDVGKILLDGLAEYGVVGIDGSTPDVKRGAAEAAFRDPKNRVFLAQIEAAGEAIDLSPSALLWFVETAFSPKSMKQMALRITNHTQARQAIVRVCVLEGSIDEALQEILLRLWATIRKVLQ